MNSEAMTLISIVVVNHISAKEFMVAGKIGPTKFDKHVNTFKIKVIKKRLAMAIGGVWQPVFSVYSTSRTARRDTTGNRSVYPDTII